jgi:CHAT domain-containing protein
MARAKHYFLLIVIFITLTPNNFAQERSSSDKAVIEKLAAELMAAKSEEERASLLASNKGLITNDLEQIILEEGTHLFNQGEYPQSLSLFHLAQTIGEYIGDKTAIATALNGIGNNYLFQGKYDKALDFYQKSLSLREELNDKAGTARTLNGLGNVHYSQGNYDQALDYYQRSLKLSEELNDKAGIARALTGIGNIYHSQGSYALALQSYKKILELNEDLKNKLLSAGTLGNIGNTYFLQGNYVEASEYSHKSLALYEELENKAGIGRTLIHIGNIYISQGNYGLALENYRKSLALAQELEDQQTIANAVGSIGLIYESQENYDQALKHYGKSLALYEELGYKNGIASANNNIGNIYRSQGNYEEALKHYQKSLQLCDILEDKNIRAYILNNIGLVFESQGNYVQALENYQKSLLLREELKDRWGIASTLNKIGNVHSLQENHQKALEFAERTLEIAKQISNPDLLYQAYLTAGIAYQALNKPEQCHRAFEESIHTIETIRTKVIGNEQEQQRFFESKLAPYHKMVDLFIAENKGYEALAYAERAKARVILDALQSGKINITKAMTHQEQEQERGLNGELISLNTQLYREKQNEQVDKTRIANIEKLLEKARLELEAFHTGLYAAHPELKSKRVEVQPATLEDIRFLMPDTRTALLEFVITDEKILLFVLTQGQSGNQPIKLKVYTIDIDRKDLEKRVSRFRNMLADKDLAFRKPGHELYDLLLKPAQEQLKGKTTLIIVPEGILWELPFQVLQTPRNRYLLEDFTLFYTPSLTALREMIKTQQNETESNAAIKTLLAFGNPALGKEESKRGAQVLMGGALEPLPGAALQVKQLARLYGLKQSKYYIGPDAREEQVKAEASNYRILQFATHGILNNASPMYSYLVMSQTGEKSKEDGLLEAWEIMQMDLKADMAVLAACETARGRVGAGEGVIGLSWAFFVAGCPTTVVSQWKVEDTATKNLMLEFHRILKLKYQNPRSPITKAAALRQAALKMMRTMSEPHPFYWAGFVMVGDGR